MPMFLKTLSGMPGRALIALLLALFVSAPALAEQEPMNGLTMHVFMSETCPHCRAQKPFLAALDANHPELEIRHLEIMTTREHHDLLRNMASLHDVQPGSVPMIFVGGKVWTGDSRQIRREIADHVEACLDNGCPR
ncbi:MAG: thioredoxin [Wenzhouxiangella sp.]|nr:MAG: thioredoxin [Wenzhouxiangella sp.]